MLGALGAKNICPVGDEALADKGSFAYSTDEAIIVPMSVFKGNEASATNTSNRLGAGSASLGEEFTETVSTVWFVIPGGEALAGQRSVTVSTGEALPVPRFTLVGHTTRCNDLITLDATCSEFVFVTGSAVNLLVPGNKALSANWSFAHAAAETLFMPLTGLILHLLITCSEDFTTSIATCCELGIVAWTAEDFL